MSRASLSRSSHVSAGCSELAIIPAFGIATDRACKHQPLSHVDKLLLNAIIDSALLSSASSCLTASVLSYACTWVNLKSSRNPLASSDIWPQHNMLDSGMRCEMQSQADMYVVCNTMRIFGCLPKRPSWHGCAMSMFEAF